MNENIICCTTLSLILLMTAVHCDGEGVGSSSADNKIRRGSSGLIAMPRVGRRSVPWNFLASDDAMDSSSSINKIRRGSSGLISMPRVGRGSIPWTFHISGVEDEKIKRGSSGMIPFPRVGRSEFLAHFPMVEGFLDEDEALVTVPAKRREGSSGETNGMWFGPRLGKRNKRAAEYPWAVVTVKVPEFPGNRRYGGFTPRLGRESAENEEEEETLLEEEEDRKSTHPTTNLKSHSYN